MVFPFTNLTVTTGLWMSCWAFVGLSNTVYPFLELHCEVRECRERIKK